MSKFKSSTAVKAPVAPAPVVPVYSPETFIELDVGEMRNRFPTETVGYDDITLFNVCMLPPDDLSDSEWAELLQKHQPTQEVSAQDGESLATLAQSFAARVSIETEQAMDVAVDGKEDWQGGPIIVRANLMRDFGKDLNAFAVPNSKGDKVNNPDRYSMPVTDSAGKTSMRKTSFYLQFTRSTPTGKARAIEIEQLTRANDAKAIKTDIPKAILDMDDDSRTDRVAYLKNRENSSFQSYKKAMLLHFQCIAFNELTFKVDTTGNVNEDAALNTRYKAGTVGWSFIFETDNNGEDTDTVVNSPTPIMVWERPGYETGTGEPRQVKNRQRVSIGAFLKFNVATAIKNGSTYKALLKTVERKKPEGKAPASAGDTKTETVDQGIARLVENFRYMTEIQQATDPAALAKLYSVIKADVNSKDGGELVTTIVDYRNWLNDIIDEMQLNAAYTKIVARKPELKTAKAS